MLCFGDIKDDVTCSIPEIAQVPPQSVEFARLINDAIRRFGRRGDFKGTTVPIYTCVKNGCVVWPRYVGSVRKINQCHRHIPVKNNWYEFMEFAPNWRTSYWYGWLGQRPHAIEQGRAPVYATIPSGWTTVRAYIESPLDTNKTVTLFGEDSTGQPLTTKGIGPWVDGIKKSLAVPYVEWTNIRRIDRVMKDKTNGPVRLYATDGTNIIDIAYYEPSETRPDYVRTQISLRNCQDCATGSGVIGIVKLQFVPVSADSDLVIINNIDALELMVQSIKFGRAGDTANAEKYEAMAIREGNLQLWDEDNQDDATPVDIDAMGGTRLGQQKCF